MADGVYVADPMPGLSGPAAKADQPGSDGESYFDCGVCISSNRACVATRPKLDFLRAGPSTGGTRGGGNSQSIGVPVCSRSRLSKSRTILRHAFGRRGTADSAGDPDRFKASGCTVRSG